MKSRCIPLEVDVGHGDLLLLPLVGDLPRGVGDEGEDQEGGVDDQLHDQAVCPDSLRSGPQVGLIPCRRHWAPSAAAGAVVSQH